MEKLRVKRENFVDSVNWFVDDQHVTKPDAAIERDLMEAINKSLRRHPDWIMSHSTRMAIIRMALERHHKNQKEFKEVTGGKI